jgi:hypothetical protein
MSVENDEGMRTLLKVAQGTIHEIILERTCLEYHELSDTLLRAISYRSVHPVFKANIMK